MLKMMKLKGPNDLKVAYNFKQKKFVSLVHDLFVDDDCVVVRYGKKLVLQPGGWYNPNFVDVHDTDTGKLLHSFSIDGGEEVPVFMRDLRVHYFGGKLVVFYQRWGCLEPDKSFR